MLYTVYSVCIFHTVYCISGTVECIIYTVECICSEWVCLRCCAGSDCSTSVMPAPPLVLLLLLILEQRTNFTVTNQESWVKKKIISGISNACTSFCLVLPLLLLLLNPCLSFACPPPVLPLHLLLSFSWAFLILVIFEQSLCRGPSLKLQMRIVERKRSEQQSSKLS